MIRSTPANRPIDAKGMTFSRLGQAMTGPAVTAVPSERPTTGSPAAARNARWMLATIAAAAEPASRGAPPASAGTAKTPRSGTEGPAEGESPAKTV